jgi:uncharacterized protein with HEPN domain
MKRDIQLILDDILEMIAFIETTVANKTRADLAKDRLVELAIQRAIEIISEASKHIPGDLLQLAPNIPWHSVRSIGNILRHEYHRIADEIIWDVIIVDLPALKQAIEIIRVAAPSA